MCFIKLIAANLDDLSQLIISVRTHRFITSIVSYTHRIRQNRSPEIIKYCFSPQGLNQIFDSHGIRDLSCEPKRPLSMFEVSIPYRVSNKKVDTAIF